MIYIDCLESITEDDLEGFFVGWRFKPSSKTHLELLRNSNEIILAMDEETRKIVGFITALTDKTLFAYISLLEVLPEYQGKGVGTELVRKMLKRLRTFYAIDLLCDGGLQAFYAKLGMQPVQGMLVRNFDELKRKGIAEV